MDANFVAVRTTRVAAEAIAHAFAHAFGYAHGHTYERAADHRTHRHVDPDSIPDAGAGVLPQRAA